MSDYYQTLGVAKNATPEDIKKAYRRLAGIHHPDKGGDTAKFQEIQTAYDILSNPEKRQQYDNPHQHGFPGYHAEGFPGGFHFSSHGFNFDDILGQMFGQRQRSSRPTYRTDVWVSLEQVYGGGEQVLQFNHNQVNQTIKITIPKGIDNGQEIRYEDVIPNSTLVVQYHVKLHPKYERRGSNLFSVQKIDVLDLIIGTSFDFVTIGGKTLEVTVTPMSQPGSQLRLARQGLEVNGITGDQYILLEPFIPDRIDSTIIDSIRQHKEKGKTE